MEDKYSIKNLLAFICIIILVLGIFYGITILVTNNKDNNQKIEDNYSEATIDYEKILAQNTFKQKEDTYYVFAYKNTDERISEFNNNLISYKNKENSIKVYYVELDNAFNKNNIASESDFNDGKVVFKGTTLLKVENGSLVEKYQTEDEISTALNALLGE